MGGTGGSQYVVAKRDVDGGWAWVVLVSSCLQQALYGLNYATGLFNNMFLEEFGRSRQMTAWIGSALVSLTCLMAPLSSLLMSRLGSPLTLVVGGIIGFSGLFLSYFARSFLAVFMTYGVMVGLGNGICYMPWIVAIATHFDKYRSLCYGLVAAFVGVGVMAFSPLIQYMEVQYGWRGCMLILSAIYLHMFAMSLILRPRTEPDALTAGVIQDVTLDGNKDLHTVSRPQLVAVSMMSLVSLGSTLNRHHGSSFIFGDGPNCDAKTIQKSRSTDTVGLTPLGNHGNDKIPEGVPTCHKDAPLLEIHNVCTDGLTRSDSGQKCGGIEKHHHKRSVLARVLFDVKLAILSFSLFTIHGLWFLVFMHFPNFFAKNGASSTDLATIMTIIGACSICCRLLVGLTSTTTDMSVLLVYTCSCFISGLVILLVPLLGKYFAGRMVFAVFLGFYGNAFISLMPVITLELCHLEDLSTAFSVQLLMSGFGALLAPPFGGWLYDISGGYELTFYTAGIMNILGALIILLIPIISRDPKSDGHSTTETTL